MKLVGVISDTHIRAGSTRVLPEPVYEAFKNVQMILHGGDLTSPEVVAALNILAPTLAVKGNNDTASPLLPISRRIEIENVVIGMTHGDAPAPGRPRPKKLVDAKGNSQAGADAISHFEFDDDVSCIIFGHSHRPLLQWRDVEGRRVLLLNPGSPTDRRYSPHFGVALLKIEGDTIEPQLINW